MLRLAYSGKEKLMEENNNKNKKYLIITLISIVVLILAIVATSYAVFTANLTGVKSNKLTTGYVTMSCAETSFSLTDTQALTDAAGIALNNNEATCTLNTTMNGSMTIGYDVALTAVTPSASLTNGDIKIQASKVKNGTTTYLVSSTATTGVLLSSIASSSGTYDNTITGYKIDSVTTNTSETVVYKIKAWVGSESSGGSITTTNTDGYCSDQSYTTKAACEAAGEIWGYDQSKGQAGGTFSFKLRVGASQVFA